MKKLDYIKIDIDVEQKTKNQIVGDFYFDIQCKDKMITKVLAELLSRIYQNDPAPVLAAIDLFKGELKE